MGFQTCDLLTFVLCFCEKFNFASNQKQLESTELGLAKVLLGCFLPNERSERCDMRDLFGLGGYVRFGFWPYQHQIKTLINFLVLVYNQILVWSCGENGG